MPKINFTLDGRSVSVEAEDDQPLLYLLRDELGLNNPHFGCGLAQCGACTVHLDGEPLRSCVAMAPMIEGRTVTTLRGLGTPEAPHPLQQAWCENDVPQCGYCQSGQIMTAAALLKSNPKPNDEDIDGAMAGNLCRCGTYLRIRAGIKRAAELQANGTEGKR